MRKKNLILLNQSYETQLEKANEKISALKSEIEELKEEIENLKSEKEDTVSDAQEDFDEKTESDFLINNEDFTAIEDFDENLIENGFRIETTDFDFSFTDVTELGASIIGRVIIKACDASASIEARQLKNKDELKALISEKSNVFKIEVFKILADLDLENPREELNKVLIDVDMFFKPYIL